MSTQKNEHNPDKLRPETVGEGWRLLTKGEVQEIGDEWWYGGEWCPVHRDNVGRHYEFTTTRRRITPPTDTTGSGREGETDNDKEAIARLEDWLMIVLGNEGANHPVLLDWARVRMLLKRQRLEVEALRRDGERLVKAVARILEIDKKQGGSISTLSDEKLAEVSDEIKANPEKFRAGAYHDIAEQTLAIIDLRAAIDSAQRQEKP